MLPNSSGRDLRGRCSTPREAEHMPEVSGSGDDETPLDVPPELFSGKDRNPPGWLFLIEGDFGPGEVLPPEAIRGAWAVDANGKPVGRLRRNPKFRPHQLS
jgi:hypothetical protein